MDNETPNSDPLIGKVISERYRVLERIGRGGFGAVYKVQHIRLDKTLALKVLFEHSHQNPRMIKRFEREARATCRIGHDNIVEITDFARDRRVGYYFVMEYLEGETLCDRLHKLGPMSNAKIIHVSCQITDALAATHAKGIVHRDLKPDNVFLVRKRSEEDFVKILDFGIAAMGDLEEDVPRLTRHGMMLGTPAYMSPEQAEGKTSDHRSDIYSLGVLLYEMTTGSVPFKNASSLAVLEMHRTTPPVEPQQARPDLDISPALEQVILRALRKPNSERYQSMREMYNDLVNVSQQIDMSSVIARRPEMRVDSPMTPPAEGREPEEPDWIDEDLILFDDLSPVPESVTRRPRHITAETQLRDAASRATREEPLPSSGDDTRRDSVDLHVDSFPPALPMDTDEHSTIIEPVPAFDISSKEVVPLGTLQIQTRPKAAPVELIAPPSDVRPASRTVSVWHSPMILILSNFLLTLIVYGLVTTLWPDRTRLKSNVNAAQESAVKTVDSKVAEPAAKNTQVDNSPAPANKSVSAKANPAKVSAGEVTEKDAPVLVKISIRSSPTGARVSYRGNFVGVTPLEYDLPKSEQPQRFKLFLSGYQPKSQKVTPVDSTIVTVKLAKLAKRSKSGDYQIWDKPSTSSEKNSYEIFD